MTVKKAFVTLLVVTIVWMLFCYQHIVAYKQMVREYEERFKKMKEEYEKSGFPKPLRFGMMKEESCCRRNLSMLKPFWDYGSGPFLILSGFMVCMAWLLLALNLPHFFCITNHKFSLLRTFLEGV